MDQPVLGSRIPYTVYRDANHHLFHFLANEQNHYPLQEWAPLTALWKFMPALLGTLTGYTWTTIYFQDEKQTSIEIY